MSWYINLIWWWSFHKYRDLCIRTLSFLISILILSSKCRQSYFVFNYVFDNRNLLYAKLVRWKSNSQRPDTAQGLNCQFAWLVRRISEYSRHLTLGTAYKVLLFFGNGTIVVVFLEGLDVLRYWGSLTYFEFS